LKSSEKRRSGKSEDDEFGLFERDESPIDLGGVSMISNAKVRKFGDNANSPEKNKKSVLSNQKPELFSDSYPISMIYKNSIYENVLKVTEIHKSHSMFTY
jgi:hypothetical protein